MKYALIIGFVLMAAAQWYAPLSMIVDANRTIDVGVEYKFRTRPIDPSDPFRGKYITLSFDQENYNPIDTNQAHFEPGTEVYATLQTDSAGFAEVSRLSAEIPEGNNDYIAVQFQSGYIYDDQANITLAFPFTRFYLEESKASEAEQLYWQSRWDTAVTCYARVKVWQGDAKLVDVMLNDSSIVDVVRRMNLKNQVNN